MDNRGRSKFQNPSPSNYFGTHKLTRDIMLNQVSTARILTGLNSDNASGLDIVSKIKSVESPKLRSSSPRPFTLCQNTHHLQWQPLKTSSKPVFGAIKATGDISDTIAIIGHEAIAPTSPSYRTLDPDPVWRPH